MSNLIGNCVVLEISSAFALLNLVDQVSEQFGQAAGLDEDSVFGLALAVREAVVNGIKHGNGGDERKRVRVVYAVAHEGTQPRVVVRVRDEGLGFDLDNVASPLTQENVSATNGRGILLMRSFMDDVRVHHAPGNGTEITMTKAISRALPAG